MELFGIFLKNSFFQSFFFQARTLAPVLAENNEIRFFVATQTLKPQNQIHLVELSENSLQLKQRVSFSFRYTVFNDISLLSFIKLIRPLIIFIDIYSFVG